MTEQADVAQSATTIEELRTHWRRHVRKALAQPYLMALLAGSLLLSFASFFTTFAGMLHFMPVWLITFCIVFAIQALLFVTSWRIGFAVADRERLPLFTAFVFLICLCTSVFFSWVALFERINDADVQQRTRTTRIHRAAEDTVSELQARLLVKRREAVQTLLAAPEYAAWTNRVERVTQTALESRSALEASLRDAALESAGRIEALERERAEILSESAAAGERRSSKESALAQIEQARPAQVDRLETLRRELVQAEEAVLIQEGKMEAEAKGGASGNGSGRGRVWRQLRDERNVLEAQRGAKQALFDRQSEALAETDRRMATLRAEIAGADAASDTARLAVIEQSIERMRGGDQAEGGAGADLDAMVGALRADLAAMATQVDLEPLDRAAARCGDLLAALQAQPALAGAVATLDCDRAALAGRLTPIRVMEQNQAALTAQCVSDGDAAASISGMDFEPAVAFARRCVDLAGLPSGDIADLRGEIARLVLEEAPDASQFVKTVNAWKSGDKLAYFALAIALFIDLLVLFSGLIGALSGSAAITQHFDRTFNRRKADNFVRALSLRVENDAAEDPGLWTSQAILRNSEPFMGGDKAMRGYTAVIDLDKLDDPRLRGAIRQFLMGLYADNLVKPDENASATRFYLKTNVLDALRHHLFEGGDPERRQARPPAARAVRAALMPPEPAPAPSRRRLAAPAAPTPPSRAAAPAPDAPPIADNVFQFQKKAELAAAEPASEPAAEGDAFNLSHFMSSIDPQLEAKRAAAADSAPRRPALRRPPAAGGEE